MRISDWSSDVCSSDLPEHRWDMIERIARRLKLDLAPDEIWLLVQIARRDASFSYAEPHTRPAVPKDTLDALAHRLIARGLARADGNDSLDATDEGRALFAEIGRQRVV